MRNSYQLFYISSSTLDSVSIPIELKKILERSRSNNLKNKISGVLFYKSEFFLQLLEGSETQVRQLFDKIQQDPRNSNVIEVFSIKNNPRLYSDWSMAYVPISEIDLAYFNELLNWNFTLSRKDNIDNDLILRMLERIKERLGQKKLTSFN